MPTAREFVHEFVLHYFAAEGKLWRTLGVLIARPGRLTLEYLHGKKLSYVLPLRLYLTVSVAFFLVLKVLAASSGDRISSAIHLSLNDGRTAFTIIDLGFGRAVRTPDGALACDLPIWLCDRVRKRILETPGELERRYSAVSIVLVSHLSTAMFLLLPLFACYLLLAYPKRTYGEHFLFALHVHSFWFLLLLVGLFRIPIWLQAAVVTIILAYNLVALNLVYPAAWWKTILKGLTISAAYLVTLGVTSLLIAVWAIVA